MATFFFDFRQGDLYTADTEGLEFPDVESAYLEASRAAQDMWRELLIRRQNPLLCAFEVRDKAGHDLFTLPFSEILDVCRDRGIKGQHACASPPFVEAIQSWHRARKAFTEITSAIKAANANLQETKNLLAQVPTE